MMNFIRRYGWYVFLVPSAIFIIDDIATNWHDRSGMDEPDHVPLACGMPELSCQMADASQAEDTLLPALRRA
jgi:hypothetical protein